MNNIFFNKIKYIITYNYKKRINCLEVINDKLFSGSRDYSIKIWNLKNVINLHTNYNRHISLLDTYSNHEGLFRNSVYFLISTKYSIIKVL